jgi:hypothetical protein
MLRRVTYRSKDYLAYVHTLPCVVTGVEHGMNDIVAHHVRWKAGAGTGMKPSDYWCLPLTAVEHTKLHQVGEEKYWKSHGIDPHEAIAMNLLVYAARLVAQRKNYVQDIGLIEDAIEAVRQSPKD